MECRRLLGICFDVAIYFLYNMEQKNAILLLYVSVPPYLRKVV